MTSTLISRDEVARVGARVRAADRIDAAHTDRGVVIALNAYAPVATVRFACACVAYVPLRRLVLDTGPLMPLCEVPGCERPRWEGPYCPSHPTGPSFEPKALSDLSPLSAPSARSGGADIDDPGTKARGGSTPSPRARQPRATGTAAARSGAGGAGPSPAPARTTWTRERCIEALRAWAAEHGRTPTSADWATSGAVPTRQTIANAFGSWGATIAAAGFEPRGPWTRDRIIEAAQAWMREHGRPPKANEWRVAAPEHPTTQTVYNAFETGWPEMLDAAGLPRNIIGRPRKAT